MVSGTPYLVRGPCVPPSRSGPPRRCGPQSGVSLDRNVHVDYAYGSLIKYFGVFNHIKLYVSRRMTRQLYFAFTNSRIIYGIEFDGHYAKEHLGKLQTLQNKHMKLLLKLDRHTSTNQLHSDISLSKVSDIQTVGILSFLMRVELVGTRNYSSIISKYMNQGMCCGMHNT